MTTEPTFEQIEQDEFVALKIIKNPAGSVFARTTGAWREVDDVMQWLIELVRAGDVWVSQDDTSQFRAYITEQGWRRAEIYLHEQSGPAMEFRLILTGSIDPIDLSAAELRVLNALGEEVVDVDELPVRCELTKGQVLHALAVLRHIGLVKEQW